MRVDSLTGRYVLAVSGGVDSMVLLDMLANAGKTELIIAHFNHGMRLDSGEDEKFVETTAQRYNLKVEVGQGHLDTGTSEDDARQARYEFLNNIKAKYRANGLITAHHQDDLIETAFLNLLRGSGRRGLSAIADSDVVRPLLNVPKADIIKYAEDNQIIWREDSTNAENIYLRNYLRHKILSGLGGQERKSITGNIEKVAKINQELNKQIATLSHSVNKKGVIDRSIFIALPNEIANELVMLWLREQDIRNYDRNLIYRLTLSIKTGQPGTKHVASKNLWLKIGKKTAIFARSG